MPTSLINTCLKPACELCFGRYFFAGDNSARSRSISSMRAETKAERVSILCFNARSLATRAVLILGGCTEPVGIIQRSCYYEDKLKSDSPASIHTQFMAKLTGTEIGSR